MYNFFWYIAHNWNKGVLATPARTMVRTPLIIMTSNPVNICQDYSIILNLYPLTMIQKSLQDNHYQGTVYDKPFTSVYICKIFDLFRIPILKASPVFKGKVNCYNNTYLGCHLIDDLLSDSMTCLWFSPGILKLLSSSKAVVFQFVGRSP